MHQKKKISLVIPVYNEQEMIVDNLKTIIRVVDSTDCDLEVIAVDDGSKDSSLTRLKDYQQEEARLKIVAFTRNFGKEAAIQAGLEAASGDACVVMDSDLQHPPELIPEMIAMWRQGIYVVEGVKVDRGEESIKSRVFANGFYYLFFKATGLSLKNHSDFKLLDKKVVDTYLSLPERERFFRGLVHWISYPSASLPFNVAERVGGQSSWGQLKLMKYAINNITSFSSMPLKLIGLIGAITLLIGFFVGAISIVQKIAGHSVDGFTTVNLLIILMGGAILFSLGILGHYLSRIYNEIKSRPSYVIKKISDSDEIN
ncbi:MAG TPA: glycosyltransferase family 2 protein [Alcaligenaceae bacterium]|nr:glycosyltransferase family 2 protein [Alcaligenaceae bacterium]